MIMYLVTALIFVLIFVNYFLGSKLYKEPKNEGYFHNIKHYNVIHQRDIMTAPGYVFIISVTLGIFLRNIFITRQSVTNQWIGDMGNCFGFVHFISC